MGPAIMQARKMPSDFFSGGGIVKTFSKTWLMLRLDKFRKRQASWHSNISHGVHELIPALYILHLQRYRI